MSGGLVYSPGVRGTYIPEPDVIDVTDYTVLPNEGEARVGMGQRMRNGYNSAKNAAGNAYNSVRSNRIAGFPLRHPVATAVGVGAAVLAPRVIGSMLPAETKERVAQNPVGSFLTGLDPNDPVIQRNAMIDRAENHAQRMRQELKDDTMEMARFQTDLAYEEAKRRAPLEYGWGSAVKFRDVYANQLDDQVNQYLNSMAHTNTAVRNILEGSKLQIM